ncbi:MAG TPA: NAD-dependent epimerase/dehydratase family protein [Kofleriaceae bacterium]|nr:NAD-dependent epimerase/dehydratase family protein [Kofleriaceae bacterium]
MTVLVTGASGFIGRSLVARLRRERDAVRALVLPGEAAPLDAEIARGDVTRPETLTPALRRVRTVYHLAAVVGDWGAESLYQAVNVTGTRNLLGAAADAGVERVVVVSSVVVYGSQLAREVCDEDLPREHGCGPYSRSKRAQEELALDFHRFGRVPVTVVRPGNVFGPGSINWVDMPVAMLRAGRLPLIDGGRGDAALTWVENLVDLLVLAARSPAAAGRVYNANDGSGVTWARYFTELARVAGARPPRLRMPGSAAMATAVAMEAAWRLTRRRGRPLFTREAVTLLASGPPVPVRRAAVELGFAPAVGFHETMERLAGALAPGRPERRM